MTKMKTIDFQDWTVIAGDDVRRQAERDIFQTFHPNLYDAVMLVSRATDQPPSVILKDLSISYGCSEEYSFTREILLSGSGVSKLHCPSCNSPLEICHRRTRALDGSLVEFVHHLGDISWITITPYACQRKVRFTKLLSRYRR